ncbi:12887_t:CDS:2 [Ambispora gerdemannii]|uniref:12887_t:CDS:1 n=1 Tax=Ambispora gerdemannii TaxID=144530 RepID=A0A9N8YIU7_9GLOM|nr:12887_t:CDS:2 [Ambispora gerdemannii]
MTFIGALTWKIILCQDNSYLENRNPVIGNKQSQESAVSQDSLDIKGVFLYKNILSFIPCSFTLSQMCLNDSKHAESGETRAKFAFNSDYLEPRDSPKQSSGIFVEQDQSVNAETKQKMRIDSLSTT